MSKNTGISESGKKRTHYKAAGTKSGTGKPRTGRKGSKKRRRRKKRRDMLLRVGFAAALVIFLISAISLIRIGLEYKKGTDTYDQVAQNVLVDSTENVSQDNGNSEEAEEAGGILELPSVNFESLKGISADAEGWIYFPDMDISYPIVYGRDNAYYLTHMIDGSSNSAGTLFTDQNNSRGFLDTNTIIYGHNMKNGSMFGKLKKYGKEEYYREHPLFYLCTETGVWEYDIFSVRVVDAASDSYTLRFESSNAFAEYLDRAFRTSMYDTGVSADSSDTIVTLSTCTSRDTDRLIVQAVRGVQVR
ncbi:MAG: class B sortase [Lachnospiraceae bacterium]|nr:class B sortase [Lachnospiraceae bacterium]